MFIQILNTVHQILILHQKFILNNVAQNFKSNQLLLKLKKKFNQDVKWFAVMLIYQIIHVVHHVVVMKVEVHGTGVVEVERAMDHHVDVVAINKFAFLIQ